MEERIGNQEEDMPPVVLYDGACGLCHWAVRFVLARERTAWCRFAPLQSGFARTLLGRLGRHPDELDTMYVWTGKDLLDRSEAALLIARHLRAPWRWATLGRIIPRRWRDALYDLIARRRYRLFGRLSQCEIPALNARDRFLE